MPRDYNAWMAEQEPNAWIPHPLRKLGGLALTLALNRLVALDPDTREAIGRLEGRRIGVSLRGPQVAFAIAARNSTLQIEPPPGAGNASASDFEVKATPGALLAMALERDGDARAPGKVEIAGDAELARQVQKLARAYKPDFEAAFAVVFGEVVGTTIARALRDAAQWASDGARHFRDDTIDWLRDEARVTVPHPEMNAFLDDVDDLRERAERLAARVRHLDGKA